MKLNHIKKLLLILSCTYLSSLYAADTIQITVKTEDPRAAAIGFLVEKHSKGKLGNSYTGKGLKNKKYTFGYRKDFFTNPDVTCGELVLTKDTSVLLVPQGKGCRIVVQN